MKTWGDVFGLGDQELVTELADVTSHESALAATRLTLLAEIDRRGLAMKLGHSSVARWYARSVRITDGSAGHQMEVGQWLTQWPSVLDALAGGDIHAAHASAIADGYATVLVADPTLDENHRDAVVAELLETALGRTAGQVTSRAQALAYSAAEDARARHEKAEHERREQEQASRADAAASGADDGESSDDADRDDAGGGDEGGGDTNSEPAGPKPVPWGPPPVPVSENPELNRFDIHPLANGRYQFGGNADRLLAEKLLTALSALTAPRPGPGGERDPRSPSKRRADALDQILDRHLRGGSSGSAGGSRASVHLIVPLRELLARGGEKQTESATTCSTGTGSVATSCPDGGDGSGAIGPRPDGAAGGRVNTCGTATGGGVRAAGRKPAPEPGDPDWPFHLDWTGPISRSLAELITCDADLTPVIVDHHGVPLALGRTTRLASADQRIALTIRDTCCVMCGRPAQWCQAHHVKFWEDGGPTDLNNLALVCGECHRLVHHCDWQMIMGDDGHPYSIPPESVDPSRQPIPSYHRRKRRAA